MARRRKRLYLAPAGRHVYSRATCKCILKPQRGDMFMPTNHQLHGGTCALWKREALYLAPAGRFAYTEGEGEVSPLVFSPSGATCL